MVTRRAASLATLAILFALGAGATPAVAKDKGLRWEDCGDGFQCATAAVPKDYGKRRDGTLDIAVIRKPATDRKHRIGSLFVNYGGPGGDGVQTTRDAYEGGLFDTLNDRFDIVSFDPRGTGQSERAIDCKANQETDGVYASRSRRRSTSTCAPSPASRRATSGAASTSTRTSSPTRRPRTSPATWISCATPSGIAS